MPKINIKTNKNSVKKTLALEGIIFSGNEDDLIQLYLSVGDLAKKEINLNEFFFNDSNYYDFEKELSKYFGSFNKRSKYVSEGVNHILNPETISIEWIKNNLDRINKILGKTVFMKESTDFSIESEIKYVQELWFIRELMKTKSHPYDWIENIINENNLNINDTDSYQFKHTFMSNVFGFWKSKLLTPRYLELRNNVHVKQLNKYEDKLDLIDEPMKHLIRLEQEELFYKFCDSQIKKQEKYMNTESNEYRIGHHSEQKKFYVAVKLLYPYLGVGKRNA